MDNYVCFLITVCNVSDLEWVKCALKVNIDALSNDMDIIHYPLEPENREVLHGLLPLHVRNVGKIVDVETIFDVHIEG
ncbi:MAG: hypothetical protein DRP09_15835 [Candidatus Thorarchaeota archaeon]|nr:MAG: hypothetical protein DRP09_15835 [Candidatus Thorarchaeota archaeon]